MVTEQAGQSNRVINVFDMRGKDRIHRVKKILSVSLEYGMKFHDV
jgi:hypothetical protein